MPESFSPRERIRKKKDFSLLYKKGQRHKSRYFIYIYLSNKLGLSRMAVVVSKKIGNATQRNRIKRWGRTLFRRNKPLIKYPIDLILIPKKEIHGASWASLKEDYATAIKSICNKNFF